MLTERAQAILEAVYAQASPSAQQNLELLSGSITWQGRRVALGDLTRFVEYLDGGATTHDVKTWWASRNPSTGARQPLPGAVAAPLSRRGCDTGAHGVGAAAGGRAASRVADAVHGGSSAGASGLPLSGQDRGAGGGGSGYVRGDLSCGGVPGARVTPVYSTPEVLTSMAYAANFDADTPPLLSLSRRVMFFMRHHDVVVDLNCGDSDWIHQMRSCVLSCKLSNVSFLAFGHTPPQPGRRYGYKPGDWFNLTLEDFVPPVAQRPSDSATGAGGGLGAPPPPPEGPPVPERLVIGLSPPWDTAGVAAAEFVRRAAQLRPRLLILLMPGSVPLPDGYILFDKHARLFERLGEPYVPRRRGGNWRQADNELTFFLLQRADTTEKYEVRTETGRLNECWNPDPGGQHKYWLPGGPGWQLEGAEMARPKDGGGAGLAVAEESEYNALARKAAALSERSALKRTDSRDHSQIGGGDGGAGGCEQGDGSAHADKRKRGMVGGPADSSGSVDIAADDFTRQHKDLDPDFLLPTCDVTLQPDQDAVLRVRCSAGDAELQVPAGAVTCPTRVCLAVRAVEERSIRTLGPFVALLPHGLKLQQAASLTVSLPEHSDVVMLYNPGNDSAARDWRELNSSSIEFSSSSVTLLIDHFCYVTATEAETLADPAAAEPAAAEHSDAEPAAVEPAAVKPEAMQAIPASASRELPSSVLQPSASAPEQALQSPTVSLARSDKTLAHLAAAGSSGAADIMISYRVPETGTVSTGDGSAFHLRDALRQRGYTVFVGESDIVVGNQWPTVIQAAVEGCRAFIPLCSKTYGDLKKSKWSFRELVLADNLDKPLLPVWHSGQYPPHDVMIYLTGSQRAPAGEHGMSITGLEVVVEQLIAALQLINITPSGQGASGGFNLPPPSPLGKNSSLND